MGVFKFKLVRSKWFGLSDFFAEDFPEIALKVPGLKQVDELKNADFFIIFYLLAIPLRLVLTIGNSTNTFPRRAIGS